MARARSSSSFNDAVSSWTCGSSETVSYLERLVDRQPDSRGELPPRLFELAPAAGQVELGLRDLGFAAIDVGDGRKPGFAAALRGIEHRADVLKTLIVHADEVFGTNVPESTLDHTNTCSSGLGEARLYTVNFKDATSVIDQQPDGLLGSNDRYSVNRGGGLPPPPTLITTIIDGRLYEGIQSGPNIIPPPGNVIGRRTRVWWNIRNETN